MQLQNRQLAAILFTDIVGYTAMMQKDEQNALAVTRRYIISLKQSAEAHQGKILNDYGDGSLCAFPSAIEAIQCAIEIQQLLQNEPKVPLRIGIHIGELFFEENKVMGDSVNIASRIQSLGQANTILFSKEVFDKLRNQPGYKSISLGKFEFKNVDEPMEIFALANEGLTVPKREQLSGKLKEIKKKSALKKWIIAAIAVIAAVTALFIYQNRPQIKGFSEGDKTIAVLPFDNAGIADNEEYVSDGITQDIINSLSKISDLQKVIGWFSVKRFKKTTKVPRQIANELGVTALLTGSIQRQGHSIRIVAELIDVNTNKRLWGDDFTYDNKDILSIQTKIAAEIVNALKTNLTSEEKKALSKHYTENTEAYKLYRKGRYFWDTRTKESFDSAETYYKKALALDPDYALAYTGLADLYLYPVNGLSQLEAVPIAKDYTTKAILLDSTLGEAFATMGFIQSAFDYDWVKAKKTLIKALELNPNYPTAHIYYGNLLQYTGESTERGIAEIKKAIELDPLSVQWHWVLGRNYFLARQYDSAYTQLRKTLALDAKHPFANGTLALVQLSRKNYSEAFDLIRKFPEIVLSRTSDYRGPYLSYAYSVSGDSIRAKQELQRTLTANPDQNQYFLARAYVGLKDYKDALNQLENAYDIRNLHMYYVKADPTMDPIRNEPRFRTLMKKMGLN